MSLKKYKLSKNLCFMGVGSVLNIFSFLYKCITAFYIFYCSDEFKTQQQQQQLQTKFK